MQYVGDYKPKEYFITFDEFDKYKKQIQDKINNLEIENQKLNEKINKIQNLEYTLNVLILDYNQRMEKDKN